MTEASTPRGDLEDILDAIREVEASLEKRQARANAATSMVWGAVASAILLYYQLVNVSDAARGLVPPALVPWMWVPPIVVGYLVTTAIGARLGRMTRDPDAARDIRKLLIALVVPIAAVTFVVLTGEGLRFVPAMWLVFLGLMYLAFEPPKGAPGHAFARGVAVASIMAGIVLAVTPALHPWGNGIAGAWYALFLFGTGAVDYYTLGR